MPCMHMTILGNLCQLTSDVVSSLMRCICYKWWSRLQHCYSHEPLALCGCMVCPAPQIQFPQVRPQAAELAQTFLFLCRSNS